MVQRKQMLGLPIEVAEDGTIKLPKDMLEFAGIFKTAEVFADRHCVYLKTADIWCEFCGNNGNIEMIGEKHICPNCLDAISKSLEGKKL